MTPEEMHAKFDGLSEFSKDLVAFASLVIDLGEEKTLANDRDKKGQMIFEALRVFRHTNILQTLVIIGDEWKKCGCTEEILPDIIRCWYDVVNDEYQKDKDTLVDYLDSVPSYRDAKFKIAGLKQEPEVEAFMSKKGDRK